MIRLTIIIVYVLVVIVLAFRDWYKGTCGLVLMMAFLEHPDVPKSIMGIPGFNIWNLVFLAVVAGFLMQHRRENLRWDLSRPVTIMLLLYAGVILVGWGRLFLDRGNPYLFDESTSTLISEQLINTLKWPIPGLLLFYGCNSRKRLYWGLAATVGVFAGLAIQVIKWMPPQYVTSGDELSGRALKILMNEIGFHRVTMSMMLAGASWAMFALRPLAKKGWQTIAVWVAFGAVVYAQALTGGRAGYATWGLLGLILCIVAWRKYLLFVPVAVLAIVLLVPGVVERMTEGMNPSTHDTNEAVTSSGVIGNEEYTVTSGRTFAWHFIIQKIEDNPIIGYGRLGMARTGLVAFLWFQFGENFPHPHNAYLEILLDNGIIGAVLILPFYFVVVRRSASLLLDKRNPLFMAAGGVSLALVLALMLASLGSQSFYPIEASLPMWAAMGLMLRVWTERKKAEERLLAAEGVSSRERQLTPLHIWPDEDENAAAIPALEPVAVERQLEPVRGWRAAMEVKPCQPRR